MKRETDDNKPKTPSFSGSLMRKTRMSKGITRSQMAEALHISKLYYVHLEKGFKLLPERLIMKIAAILELPVDKIKTSLSMDDFKIRCCDDRETSRIKKKLIVMFIYKLTNISDDDCAALYNFLKEIK